MESIGSTNIEQNTTQSQGQLFNFFVVVTGVTHGAHETFVRELKRKGQNQKNSVEESDYILAFCPIPSRAGTDIQEAMGKIPSGKPVILVVMHHRHDVEAYLDDSSRHVTRRDVILTVDTLFWERGFLNCSHYEKAFNKVLDAVGHSSSSLQWRSAMQCRSAMQGVVQSLLDRAGQSSLGTSLQQFVYKLHLALSPFPSAPWRNIDWKGKGKLLDEVNECEPQNESIKHVRILLHGPVGAGKSSFINSVSSALRGSTAHDAHVDNAAGTSCTITIQTHKIQKGDSQNFYPFVFNDITGREEQEGIQEEDITFVMKGHVKDGYRFNPAKLIQSDDPFYNHDPMPGDKTHVLVLVIPADRTSSLDSMKKMRDIAVEMGIPQILILTKIDKSCPLVKNDVENVYRSKNLKEKLEECSTKVGIPMGCIFPVNYHEDMTTDVDGDKIDVLILKALKKMIDIGEDFINKMESDPMSEYSELL